jgi:hypothetical protein
VIVTASDYAVPARAANPAVVALARRVTPGGFELAARNSDTGEGATGFNWIAVLEEPTAAVPSISIRFGILAHRPFTRGGTPGDWNSWMVRFSRPMNDTPIGFATAHSVFVTGGPAPLVPVAKQADAAGFLLEGRNSDSVAKYGGFYYASVTASPDELSGDVSLDSGEVEALDFWKSGTPGDWREWEIYFQRPFLTPPVVLVTANDLHVPSSAYRCGGRDCKGCHHVRSCAVRPKLGLRRRRAQGQLLGWPRGAWKRERQGRLLLGSYRMWDGLRVNASLLLEC